MALPMLPLALCDAGHAEMGGREAIDWESLGGNWRIEIDLPDTGTVEGHLSWSARPQAFVPTGRGIQGGNVAYDVGTWSFDGKVLRGTLWIWRHRGQRFEVTAASHDRLEGSLWNPDLGASVPLRLLRRVPVVESVTVLRKTFEGGDWRTDDDNWDIEVLDRLWSGNLAVGTLPEIRLVLRGRELPLAQRDVAAVRADAASVLYPSIRAIPLGDEAIFVDVRLGAGTRPGVHRMFLNGEPFSFDLVFANVPIRAPPAIRYVVFDGERRRGLQQLPVGETFFVEVIFFDPSTVEEAVTLVWPGGSASVPLATDPRDWRRHLGGPLIVPEAATSPPVRDGP